MAKNGKDSKKEKVALDDDMLIKLKTFIEKLKKGESEYSKVGIDAEYIENFEKDFTLLFNIYTEIEQKKVELVLLKENRDKKLDDLLSNFKETKKIIKNKE